MKILIFSTLLLSLTIIKGQDICPDLIQYCDVGTCCPSLEGFGCCPLDDAECCADLEHCCPGGYVCVVEFEICVQCPGLQGRRNFTMKLEPLLEPFSLVSYSNSCPQCPNWATCCPMTTGQIGCCPLENAVCCSDKEHCCPHGYTCDASGFCTSNTKPMKIPKIQKHIENSESSILFSEHKSLKQNSVDLVQCPDGNYCNSGNTCCLIGSNTYGCCPFRHAVCCSDKVHCCPNGMTCDSSGYCTNGPDIISWFEKKPAIKRPKIKNKMKVFVLSILLAVVTIIKGQVICPDSKYQCKEGQTCCKTNQGYGCCPMEDAVCCSDLQHCCPDEYICVDLFEICVKCPDVTGKHNFTRKLEPLREPFSLVIHANSCPQCPNWATCCPMTTGQIGCCPLENAVCCSDKEHCCPHGYTCDASGFCTSSTEPMENPRMQRHVQNSKSSILSSKHKLLKRNSVDLVQCPDGNYCNSGNTCCLIGSNTYGCCPFPRAVCCSDKVHCCPNGMTCDRSGYCTNGPDVISWFEKKPAIKRPKIEN
ncbi:granulins-like [Centruroides sculpturatus]|uniref:granulins-like n=2 Tax=Centruroides sculpturatus TaxID=218467 RepID=UPI000C6DFE37|nr:granulins-like [Centruroides sculpturatus]